MRAPDARRRASRHPARGQHLLRSDAIASELVGQAGIRPDELVFEIGPGLGRLTAPLARSAGRVIAVEIDEAFATQLRGRFHHASNVEVVVADALDAPLPSAPFRVVGNLPFGSTTHILRRLLDTKLELTAVDVVVEWNVARKRASPHPANLVSLGWLPWWTFDLVRHLPASAFEPRPSVDAGFLAIRPRATPLLRGDQRAAYRAMLARAFRKANVPVTRALVGTGFRTRAIAACVRDRGFSANVRPTDLDVFDWVALFAAAQPAGAQKNSSAMPSGSRKLRSEP